MSRNPSFCRSTRMLVVRLPIAALEALLERGKSARNGWRRVGRWVSGFASHGAEVG